MNTSSSPARWASVDALRGITVAVMLPVNNPGDVMSTRDCFMRSGTG